MVKMKHKEFIGATLVMPCQASSWIMGLRIYGQGRTQILLSLPAMICPLARIQDRQGIDRVYTDIKIANNNKINHIMVSFTDHYNAISIDRPSSKTKIGNDSWKRFIKIILLCKPDFSQELLFLLKTERTTTLEQVTGGNTRNIVLKRMLRYFLKSPPLKI